MKRGGQAMVGNQGIGIQKQEKKALDF